MKSKFIFFLFFFSIRLGFGQSNSKPEWIENSEQKYPRDLFFSFSGSFDAFGNDDYKNKLEKLKIDLNNGLASSINTSVKTEVNSKSSQITNNNSISLVSSHSKNTKLNVDIDLPEAKISIWPENYLKSEKKYFGIIAVEKSILQNSLESRVSVELNNIDRELISSPRTKSNNDLVKIINNSKLKIDEIVSKIALIKAIDNDFNESFFFEKLKTLSIRLDEYSSALSNKEYEDMYIRAKKYLDDNKCINALNDYKVLSRLNSSDERVIRDKQSALLCVNQELIVKAAQYMSKNEYYKSVSVFDSLITLNPENSKLYENDRKNCIDKYFIQSFNLIEVYLQSNLSEAKKILDGIQVFGTSEYNTKISEYRVRINSLYFKHRTLEFKNSIHQNDFANANRLISVIGNENSTTPNIVKKLSSMGNKLNKATYSFEKKQLLKTRPNLYCFNFGFSLGSQYLTSDEISQIGKNASFESTFDSKFAKLIPSYSFSFFRKLKINPRFSSTFRDKSKSNLIGFKFIYHDIKNQIIIQSPNFQGPSINNFNLLLSTMIFRFLNFDIGINSNNLNKIDINQCLSSTSLGIKIPLWRFKLDLNVNYLSNFKTKNLLNLESSLTYNLNFKPKFSKSDKDFVKLKSQKWRI